MVIEFDDEDIALIGEHLDMLVKFVETYIQLDDEYGQDATAAVPFSRHR